MVLTDDNFATIQAAVEEGRGIFDNLTKIIAWVLPTNLGLGLIILLATFLNVPLPVLPIQVLWINMVTSSTLGLALAFEPAERGLMSRAPRPPGEALLSGLYLNELLMRLLARDDAHSLLFDHYAAVVRVLATEHGEVLEPLLRSFELLLLREVGLLPALDVQTLTLVPLEPQGRYALVAEAGLRAVPAAERASLSGAQWLQLHAALRDGVPFPTLLRECAAVAGELKPQLRGLLQYHCGHPVLRTRQFMMDLQSL